MWNSCKKLVDRRFNKKVFSERDVFFMNIGLNVGFEQNGKGNSFIRPVLVVKKLSKNLFIGVPLTSKNRVGSFFVNFEFKGKSGAAIVGQVRVFDSKRILYSYGRLPTYKFNIIKEKLIDLIQ